MSFFVKQISLKKLTIVLVVILILCWMVWQFFTARPNREQPFSSSQPDLSAQNEQKINQNENCWNVNADCIVITTKLALTKHASKHPEYKTIWIKISRQEIIDFIEETTFLVLDTSPTKLHVSHNFIVRSGVKNLHFDKNLGILEIEFNEMNLGNSSLITTPPKLTITRGFALPTDEGGCQERYECNATLSYQSRFLDSNPGWGVWLESEYKSIDAIDLPSVRITP